MVSLLAGVAFLCLESASKDMKNEDDAGVGQRASAFLSIMCAIIGSFAVTPRCFVIKKYQDKSYPSIVQFIDTGILELIICSILAIFLY